MTFRVVKKWNIRPNINNNNSIYFEKWFKGYNKTLTYDISTNYVKEPVDVLLFVPESNETGILSYSMTPYYKDS